MCPECLRTTGHHHRCPYAPASARARVGECECCGKGIYEGQEMVEKDDYLFHYDCLSHLSAREVLDALDIAVSIAECD